MGEPSELEFRRAVSRLPTGVTVVTALADDGPRGATANAVTSLSLRPKLMLAALDRGSRTLAAMTDSRRFAINVLAADQEALAHRFGTKDPAASKWERIGWSERVRTPALAGVVLWIACELRDLHDGGDHVIATGAVIELEAGEADPLVFFGGAYRGLG